MRRDKELIWIPVILILIFNIIILIITHQPYTASIAWIIGAIAEELFFRFFLLHIIFLRTMKPIFAISLVSILFAGMHIFNLRTGQAIDETVLQVVFAFCFSIWAGAVTWKESWLFPLLAHVLMNATAGEEAAWVSMLVSGIVLADGVMLLIRNDVKDRRLAD